MQNTLKLKDKNQATVCILTSGEGSRLDEYTKDINKALLVVKKKAALSHIIENFPKNSNFVISIGYKGKLVKDFIKIHHPDINVKFVKVDNYNKKGSGPGTSLLKCEKYLQKEFFFVSCDTLWKKKVTKFKKYNWMGVSRSYLNTVENYCNLKLKKKKVVKIIDKKKFKNSLNIKSFVGLAFIKDYHLFWKGLKLKDKKNIEVQVIKGFEYLLKKTSIKTIDIDWNDIGTKLNYENLIDKTEKFNFSKTSQKIYISKKKVTKFFSDKKIIRKLYLKTKVNPKIFPKNIKYLNNFLSYKFEKGKTLYKFYKPLYLKKLLIYLDKNLWREKNNIKKIFYNDCKSFYFKKTKLKINKLLNKYPDLENNKYHINSLEIDKIQQILKRVPWKKIFFGEQRMIHGDLQFDNIIYSKKKNQFTLIDWRHQFGNNNIWGDLYYDYAKLLGGLEINYDFIKQNNFSIKINKKNIFLKLKRRPRNNSLIKVLLNHAVKKKLDENKIKIITGLIFLNMSPLHKFPFDKFLFYYGKYYLQKNLNNFYNENKN